MHITGRLTSCTERFELAPPKPVQDGLRYDRPRRVFGAEEKHIQGLLLSYDFHNALLAALRQRCRNEWLANLALATTTILHEKREEVSCPF
jgi:hypothetical protein